MRPVWFLALATIGCRSVLGIDEPITVTDAAVCATWHPQGFDPCALGAPMPAMHLGPGQYTYRTDASGGLFESGGAAPLRSDLIVVQSDMTTLSVLSVDALTIDPGATISVLGPRPLLIVAWSTMSIDGVIDAGSHAHGVPQLGANANVVCGTGSAGLDGTNAVMTSGSGGGGGGGFQGIGGHGGTGGTTGVPGGAGGTTTLALPVHGGCPGGASGAAGMTAVPPASQNTQTPGGAGGGAIRLVAHDSLGVSGTVSANGAGGAGAVIGSGCGGGGGGAGGYVGLEAPSVTISGTVTANGGGGGGGGATNDAGNDGGDGQADLVVAPGGAVAPQGCGRPGGAGSAQATLGGSDATGSDACGGGGGGGGAGFLLITSPGFTATATAKISPPVRMP